MVQATVKWECDCLEVGSNPVRIPSKRRHRCCAEGAWGLSHIMENGRRKYTPEEKVAIVRRQLVEKEASPGCQPGRPLG